MGNSTIDECDREKYLHLPSSSRDRIETVMIPDEDRSTTRLPAPPYTPLEPNPKYSSSDSHFLNRLNILVQVVGSRGDVQPFIALGLALKTHGHRVRIATHDVFQQLVTSSGLSFYPVGGDPAELMAYMVSSPHLVPDLATLRAGAISRKRHMYEEMLKGFWDACLANDPQTSAPFVADAIIANPPSFAHIHCAEALGIPCHLVFTMPWSSTGAFAQPLAGITLDMKGKKVGKSVSKTNYVSYAAVNFLTWQGLGDIVNRWRVESLDLQAVPSTEGPHLIETLKVPFTYCWSPSLVAKPPDWGDHIDVCGFFFRNPPPYTPPDDLAQFLRSGKSPIYIGFGSIVVGDATGLMSMVLSAVRAAGVRAVISRGWSNLAADRSDDVFFIGDCPHEWLFQQVTAVVHHGGAGTTACGLRYGRPTVIVPFFGDQPFWGAVVSQAGAGPVPLPYESLTSQKLAQAIRFCLSPAAQEAASALACKIAAEDGVANAVDSIHHHLSKRPLQCDFFPDETAVWGYRRGRKEIKMCRGVATILREHGVDLKELSLHWTGNISIENRRWDPLTAVSAASVSTVIGVTEATVDVVRKPIQHYRRGRMQEQDVVQVIRADGAAAIPSGATMLPLVDLDTQAVPEANTDKQHVSGTVAASAHSMGTAVARTTCGVLVDIPLAVTEGMRAVPQLWGEKVEEHERIHDFRSGVSVAGRSFYEGITGAVKGVFLRTYEAKKREGATGVLKGLSQGSVGLVTKTGSAVTGLVTYPAQGISKSIRAKIKSETRRRIIQARWREGEWLIKSGEWTKDVSSILQDFEGLKGRSR
ncbi:UDP-glucose,sterol transferase [Nemania sp. FL0031]|nr:UDP-glucose,sterol transferase [Nemania sp. FL0031]